MKHVDNVVAFRSAQQAAHGARVEERQRVNGQPNGYEGPITETAMLGRAQRLKIASASTGHKPTHGGYCGA